MPTTGFPEVKETHNQDIVGLYNRINRFIKELNQSQSNGVPIFTEFDQVRLRTYLDNIDSYVNWFMAQPNLDLPETHPIPWPLTPPQEVQYTENDALNDLLRMLVITREELIRCTSNRLPCRFLPPDVQRFSSYIAKCRIFLNTYISVVPPLDLPETVPSVPVVDGGNRNSPNYHISSVSR